MKNKKLLALFCPVIAGVLVACSEPPQPQQISADLVLIAGRIQTMDDGRSWAEALCIKGSVIKYVGSNEGAKACSSDKLEVIDLKGRLVIPGLMDSHMHMFGGSISDVGVNLTLANTLEDLKAALQEIKRLNPGDEPINGGGWQNFIFDSKGPRKELLDEVFGLDRAVILSSVDGHSTLYSSGALKAAGVDKSIEDPKPGMVFWERDGQTGELLGTAREGAGSEVNAKLLSRTQDDYRSALLNWLPRASASGLTGLFDAGMGAPTLQDAYEILTSLDNKNQLPIRVYSSIITNPDGIDNVAKAVLQAKTNYSSPHHTPYSIKIFADGVPEGHTAFLLDDYEDTPGKRGELYTSIERMKQVIGEAESLGVPVHTHAIGGAAVRTMLDLYEEARSIDVGTTARPRHVIGHMDYVSTDDIARFEPLDVVPQTSIQWATVDPTYDTFISYVGKEVHDNGYPIRDILNAGGKQTFGSDWPASAYLSTFKPLIQIETAVTRRLSGKTDGPMRGTNQGISVMEAIEAMTRNVAYQLNVENQLGSLEVGKKADLIVLGSNIFEIPPETIHKTRVNLTIMDGNIVYEEN